ncbi:ALF repeat-containing protein [Streptomyces sp. NPDC002403]
MRLQDERVLAARLATEGGPELKAAATIALAGPAELIHEFVTVGRYMAQRKDDLATTHQRHLQGLLAEGSMIAAKAYEDAWRAAEAAAKAIITTKEAAEASDQADESARQAEGHAGDADASADGAESSAAAASAARAAANRADADAEAAEDSAANAAFSAAYARESAKKADKAPQRPHLSDEFRDHGGRQARDPPVADDRCARHVPHHTSMINDPELDVPPLTVHELVRGVP